MSAGPTTKIEDYALIGDCETAALVARDGSIDWLCWPRFDSDACFAALLGTAEHGRWLLSPAEDLTAASRQYREGTLILETVFETSDGAVRLIDFMPPRTKNSDVVRLVVGERGHVAMQMEFILRFGYGATVPWVTQRERGVLQAVAGPDMAMLRTSVPLHGQDLRTTASFEVSAGEIVPFVLTYGPSHRGPPGAIDPLTALSSTEVYWREWSGRCKEAGPWSDAVKRPLITLKALTYAPTGGIVAAATTSLPEQIGGSRNWDYRFCWLRDAALTLLALMDAGFFDEAEAWRNWLLRAVAGSPNQMQIMYGLAGERRLTEWEVPWLPGYEGSRPVRIGNAAHGQLQLDVIGELMDALHQARRGGLPENAAAWALQCALLAHLAEIWHEPDEGIWEIRGPRQHFVHSKVMAWVAFDRGIRSAEAFGLSGPLEHWRRIRQEIHDDVCTKGYDASRGSFVQAYGSRELDASLLLLPVVGFLSASDQRIVSTIQAVEQELVRDGLVMRYDTRTTSDGLPTGEGAFLACSFWLADAYVLLGHREEATALFERLLELRNDVGLLSEEYDPILKRQVGNIPQAFSHLALINTAHNLVHPRGEAPAEQRAGSKPPHVTKMATRTSSSSGR